MASTERDYEIAMLRKQLLRERQQGNSRSIWTRGRFLEANVHGAQLHVTPENHHDMRDPATGLPYFVPGYSRTPNDGETGDPVRND